MWPTMHFKELYLPSAVERWCWRESAKNHSLALATRDQRMPLLETYKRVDRVPVLQELNIGFGLTCRKDTYISKCLEKTAVYPSLHLQ